VVIDAGGDTPANLAVSYCARGVTHQARDQLDHAIADYNEAIKIAPKSATGHRCRGFRNLAQGAIDDAITEFNEAIALDPRSASSFESRGEAYRKKVIFVGPLRTMTRLSGSPPKTLRSSTTAPWP
jgi:tetratricopeptide (TPR) repeat protein